MKKLNELTIVEARRGLQEKRFTITELTKACLEQIKKTDCKIKAFVTVCEKEALKTAVKYDQVLGKNLKIYEKKPLFGIPLAIKDNFCTKGIKTTASSNVLNNFVPPYNATVVQKLLEAGVIIIGKTNMDAWAHGSSTETSDFFTTRNPHDLTRSPGGSSGGSAAAVAAHQVTAAIGSETAGSIRQPAAWCGIVGLKPTYGRVSRFGLIAMASSTDSPGTLTKTIEDAAIILSVLAGKDPKDATSNPTPGKNYHQEITRPIKKITLGVPQEYFLPKMDKQVTAVVKKAIKELKSSGFKIKKISLIDPKYAIAVYTIIMRAEVSSNLGRYDGLRFGFSRKAFGQEARRRIMMGSHVLSAGYFDQYYLHAQKVRALILKDFKKAFKEVDAIVAPTSPSVALKIGAAAKDPLFGEMQDVLVEASAMAGLPGISLNCGWVNNLPVGLQIFAPQFQETLILKIAHQYEKNRA